MTTALCLVYIVRVSEILGKRFTLRVVAPTSISAEQLAADYLESIGQRFSCRITSVKLAKRSARFAVVAR